MKRRLKVLALATLPLLTAVPGAALDPDVLRLRESAWRAWFGGDEATLRAMLPEDFIGINMGATPFATREATIEESKAFAASGGRLVHLEFPETQAQHYGDVMVFYGRFKVVLSLPAANGAAAEQQTLEGRLTELFLKKDGRWLHTGWHLDTVAPNPEANGASGSP